MVARKSAFFLDFLAGMHSPLTKFNCSGHVFDPDSAVQNWESGITVTILACTFFRNFASYAM